MQTTTVLGQNQTVLRWGWSQALSTTSSGQPESHQAERGPTAWGPSPALPTTFPTRYKRRPGLGSPSPRPGLLLCHPPGGRRGDLPVHDLEFREGGRSVLGGMFLIFMPSGG